MGSKNEQKPCPPEAHNLIRNHKIDQIMPQINAMLQLLYFLGVKGTSCYEGREPEFGRLRFREVTKKYLLDEPAVG